MFDTNLHYKLDDGAFFVAEIAEMSSDSYLAGHFKEGDKITGFKFPGNKGIALIKTACNKEPWIIVSDKTSGDVEFLVYEKMGWVLPREWTSQMAITAASLHEENCPLCAADIMKIAKEKDLVVVFGQSDDMMLFDGAIVDHVEACDGNWVMVHSGGLLNKPDDLDTSEAMLEWAKQEQEAQKVEAVWLDGDPYSWIMKTDIPHVKFDIVEHGEKYCRGLVFSLKHLTV